VRHIDLFSGIGGFALACQMVWGNEYENVFFCDNNKFCQEVIKKNFGRESLIYDDIRGVTRKRVIADTRSAKQHGLPDGTGKESAEVRIGGGSITNTDRRHGKWEKRKLRTGRSIFDGHIDLLTGGFPCQPFSVAGKQRGKTDDRYLWPEMLRIIKEFQPTWVIGENVAGFIPMALDTVCADLEAEGYEVQPLVIPACAVNAPHRRDRVWIIGYSNKRIGDKREIGKVGGRQKPNSPGNGCHAPDTTSKRLPASQSGMHSNQGETESPDWDQNWIEVATEFCRVDDGISVELDGFKLTKAGHRVERLKALGNAIVPQVVVEILEAIKTIKGNV